MIKYRTEYRVNKKGAECFRTEDHAKALAKLAELSERRPNIYTIQSRSVRLNSYGIPDQDWRGRPAWSPWR